MKFEKYSQYTLQHFKGSAKKCRLNLAPKTQQVAFGLIKWSLLVSPVLGSQQSVTSIGDLILWLNSNCYMRSPPPCPLGYVGKVAGGDLNAKS